MSRRFCKILALMFAVALVLTGCNLIQIDETIDNAEVVVSWNGGKLTKGEVMPEYESTLAYYDALSSYYGFTFATDGVLENIVDTLVRDKVLLAKAEELGLSELTEEEEAEVQEHSEEEYEETLQNYWDNFAETGLTDEEIRADVENFLTQNGYTMESVVSTHREQEIIGKLQKHVADQVVVTEDDLQAEYEATIAAAEQTYSDLYTFESAVTTGGTTIAWYPEGYRTVKHILLTFTDEQQDELTSMQREVADLQAQIEALETAEESDEDAPTAEELQAQIDALNAELVAKIEKFAEALQPTVDEIYERIEAGDNFEALIAEYGQDPGMEMEPTSETGYYVSSASETYMPEFRDGAMELQSVGDISEPVTTSYGVHIIRYESDVTPGPVAFEQLKDGLEETVTQRKQTEEYDAQVAAWIAEADVKIDLSVIE